MNSVNEVLLLARKLRSEGKFAQSFELIVSAFGKTDQGGFLIWQHQPLFWEPIRCESSILTRRNATDSDFIQSLWSNEKFKQNFHRQAPNLPNKNELKKILDLEYLSLLGESKAIHWVIRCKSLKPWGLLSLTDVSIQNSRAEVLIGLVDDAPTGLTIKTMLSLFNYYFDVMKFNKLIALIYGDNTQALNISMKLGFKLEGQLIQHMKDPKTQKFIDLFQLGIFKEDALSNKNNQLAIRLNRR